MLILLIINLEFNSITLLTAGIIKTMSQSQIHEKHILQIREKKNKLVIDDRKEFIQGKKGQNAQDTT